MNKFPALREIIWKFRQISRRPRRAIRPVLDLVDFGSEPGIVLDVGANVGGFAMDVLVRAPLMQLHCFEPNSDLIGKLSSNASRCGNYKLKPRCVVNFIGLGAKDEQRVFNTTNFNPASSFLPISSQAKKGWPTVDFTTAKKEKITIVRLDSYLAEQEILKVKLLKLDVQGFELEVLKGSGKYLDCIEYIIAEVQFTALYEGAPLWHELVEYLKPFKFEPVVMDGFCFGPDGQPLQADILFHKKMAN